MWMKTKFQTLRDVIDGESLADGSVLKIRIPLTKEQFKLYSSGQQTAKGQTYSDLYFDNQTYDNVRSGRWLRQRTIHQEDQPSVVTLETVIKQQRKYFVTISQLKACSKEETLKKEELVGTKVIGRVSSSRIWLQNDESLGYLVYIEKYRKNEKSKFLAGVVLLQKDGTTEEKALEYVQSKFKGISSLFPATELLQPKMIQIWATNLASEDKFIPKDMWSAEQNFIPLNVLQQIQGNSDL